MAMPNRYFAEVNLLVQLEGSPTSSIHRVMYQICKQFLN